MPPPHPPPPEQTPGHLTFLKNFFQIPGYVNSLDAPTASASKKSIPPATIQKIPIRQTVMQHKCNRKLMGKEWKKYPAHQIARKKILDDQKSPTPPLKS